MCGRQQSISEGFRTLFAGFYAKTQRSSNGRRRNLYIQLLIFCHQVNSARFGWLWNGSAIELYAYCYVNGVRASRLLETVAINQQNTLAIQVKAHQYIFECNGKTTAISRHCATGAIEGYQLYPYFGGDETAPHNIHIYIKEI